MNDSIFTLLRSFQYLPVSLKFQCLFFAFVSIAASLAELVLLAATAFFVSAILEPQKYQTLLESSYPFAFQFSSSILILASCSLAFSALLATALKLYNIYYSSYLGAVISNNISARFIYSLTQKDYSYFTSNNLSSLTTRVNLSTGLTDSIIAPLLSSMANLTASIAILVGLLAYSLAPTILLLIFSLAFYASVGSYAKRELSLISRNTGDYSQKITASAAYIFENIKELAITSNVSRSSHDYAVTDLSLRQVASRAMLLLLFPKTLLEGIGLTFIALLTILFSRGGDLSSVQIITSLSVLALGLQRLVPSFHSSYNSFMALKRNWHIFTSLSCDLDYSESISSLMPSFSAVNQKFKFFFPSSIAYSPVDTNYSDLVSFTIQNFLSRFSARPTVSLRLSNLVVGYSSSNPLFRIDEMVFSSPDFGLIVGPSGSGKSALLNTLVGLVDPLEGSCSYFLDGAISNEEVLSSHTSYISQDIYFAPQSILHYMLGPRFVGCNLSSASLFDQHLELKSCLDEVCRAACIKSLIDDLPFGYDTLLTESAKQFSGGQKQRLSLAKSFLLNKTISIFDESLSAVDPVTQSHIIRNIPSVFPSSLVLIVSHNHQLSNSLPVLLDTSALTL